MIFGLVGMWLHDLLRHMPTGHNDFGATENVKVRNSEFPPWNFLWQLPVHYTTLQLQLQVQVQLQLQQLQLHYFTLRYTRLHFTIPLYNTQHYGTLHYTNYTMQLQLPLHYTNYTTLQLRLHYTIFQLQLQLHYTTLHPAVVVRWPLQPLQPLQKTQLQPPFGPSVDSLCPPWFTTTSRTGFLFLNLPPPRCAVLLVWDRWLWAKSTEAMNKNTSIQNVPRHCCGNIFVVDFAVFWRSEKWTLYWFFGNLFICATQPTVAIANVSVSCFFGFWVTTSLIPICAMFSHTEARWVSIMEPLVVTKMFVDGFWSAHCRWTMRQYFTFLFKLKRISLILGKTCKQPLDLCSFWIQF